MPRTYEMEPLPLEHPPSNASGQRIPPLLIGATVALGAFLLFQIQPMIAKQILPWFGGSAAVWTSCMLFFQLALLGGYAWAHWLGSRPLKSQILIHISLLLLSLAVLPVIPSARWKPTGGEDPLLGILGLLTATVGLPYFLLSATSPLLQSWYSRANGGAMPYRFFALSNIGSMAGLLTYPVLVEPNLTNRHQAWMWSAGFAGFVVLFLLVGFRTRYAAPSLNDETMINGLAAAAQPGAAPTWPDRILWTVLAACASALLLALTNHMTQNVAAIPFLWVLPLSLYLLSFVLCFDSDRWYHHRVFAWLAALALLAMAYQISGEGNFENLVVALGTLCAELFVLCMVCHGELARRRPPSRYLTSFYLMVSIGGACGGLLIGFVFPHTLPVMIDLPIVLAGMGFLMAWLLWRALFGDAAGSPARRTNLAICGGAVVLALAMTAYMAQETWVYIGTARVQMRNFYGALATYEGETHTGFGPMRALIHGTINHGEQFTWPQSRRMATTYYAEKSGLGRAFRTLHQDGPIRVGMIGLGAGTTAVYAQPGDRFSFYEINPYILQIAESQFTFLKDCYGTHEVILGDGRLSLLSERAKGADRRFDLLAVDAFSGDAIPIHLLTREAYNVYWSQLSPDGVLALNVSNRYLSLAPGIALAAAARGKTAMKLDYDGDPYRLESPSEWVLVTSRKGFFDGEFIRDVARPIPPVNGLREWTDDYSNLYAILK